jgi:hypothetical protein
VSTDDPHVPRPSGLPRLPRAVIAFLIIVAIGTIAAIVTTAMPPRQPPQAGVTVTSSTTP